MIFSYWAIIKQDTSRDFKEIVLWNLTFLATLWTLKPSCEPAWASVVNGEKEVTQQFPSSMLTTRQQPDKWVRSPVTRQPAPNLSTDYKNRSYPSWIWPSLGELHSWSQTNANPWNYGTNKWLIFQPSHFSDLLTQGQITISLSIFLKKYIDQLKTKISKKRGREEEWRREKEWERKDELKRENFILDLDIFPRMSNRTLVCHHLLLLQSTN